MLAQKELEGKCRQSKGQFLALYASVPILWKEVSSSPTHNGQYKGEANASTLEKEKNKISIIVLSDKSTYLARCEVSATLSFLSAGVPPLLLAVTPLKTGSS